MNLSEDKKKNPKPSFKIPWPKRPAFNKIQIQKQNFAEDDNDDEEENLKSSWGEDDTNIINEEEDLPEEPVEKEVKYERPSVKKVENNNGNISKHSHNN